MKPAFSIFLILLATNLEAQFTLADFKRLHSLEGIWVMKGPKSILFETWNIKNDSTLSGTSFKVKNTDTIYLEAVTLSFRNGSITYTPITKEQNNSQPVVFRLTEIKENNFSFANPEHDFPQVINYNLQSETRLLASISGPTAEGDKTIEYPFEKQKK
jgi:hypothetical protein